MKKVISFLEAPEVFDRKSVELMLGQDMLRLMMILKDTPISLGLEHSEYVHGFMQSLSAGAEPAELLPMFYNQDRFVSETKLFTYFSHEKTLAAVGRNISPKLFDFDFQADVFDLRCFPGKDGQESSLHFDWNVHYNLLINLVGEKKVSLFPPRESSRLMGYSNFVPPDDDRRHLEADTCVTLGPGEAVVIPPLWWHRVYYTSDACSLSVRLKTHEEASAWIQEIYPSWKIVKMYGELGSRRAEDVLGRLAREVKPLGSPAERFSFIEEALQPFAGSVTRDHAFYGAWARGYLHFKALTERDEASYDTRLSGLLGPR
jgi:hypothetical protein